jgi:thioredoxin reductase (NADPH)
MENESFKDEMKKKTQHERLVILGAGPAGLSAALYAARAELQPVVVAGMEIGGQAAFTNVIENYPGFPDGIGGVQVGELFMRQAEKFGARIEYEVAQEVKLTERPFYIETGSKVFWTDGLIIATGASPNHLNIPGEREFTGKGVSYCATCDGFFFKGKKVFVVGGGDSALEEALFLTRFAEKVTIVHRRDAFRGGAILQERVAQNEKIEVIWNTVVEAITGSTRVQAVETADVASGEKKSHQADGVFVFIGHTPNTELFIGQLKLDPKGYIAIDLLMRTSVQGVFAAGEAADPNYRQVVTSAGMGAAAAIEATRFLSER